MAWRAQLSDRPVQRLAILSTKPGVLAAWTQPDRLIFLDISSGAKVSDLILTAPADPPPAPPPKSPLLEAESSANPLPADPMDFDLLPPVHKGALWLAQMKARNGDYLPMLRLDGTTIHAAADGAAWLRGVGGADWFFETADDSKRLEIEGGARLVALAFDRLGGVAAGLDGKGRVQVFEQGERGAVFETPLKLEPDLQPQVALAEGGTPIFVSDGQRIAIFEMGGRLLKTIELHFALGVFASSPDGKTIVVGDLDAGVLRVYGGRSWTPTYQRFAVDVLAEAKRAQLMGTGTTTGAALGPIAVAAKGLLAFAIAGTVCMTTVARLKPPAPPKFEAPPRDQPDDAAPTEPVVPPSAGDAKSGT